MFSIPQNIQNSIFCIMQLASGFSFRRTGFDPREIHARFVEDKVVVGHLSARVLRFLPVSVSFQQCPIIIHLPSTPNNLNRVQSV